jgi:hypothetical protein
MLQYIIAQHYFFSTPFPTTSSIFKPELMATFHAKGKSNFTMLVGDEEFV